MTDAGDVPALWDMVPFLGGHWQADFGQLIAISIMLNTVMGAGLWWFVVRKWKGSGGGAHPSPFSRRLLRWEKVATGRMRAGAAGQDYSVVL